MHKLFNIGDKIYGYCNGFFGRDSYSDKKCVFVSENYAVFEDEDGVGHVLNMNEYLNKEFVDGWKINDEED